MGKRKSSAKAAPKSKLEPLATSFKCPFCNHEKAVSVKLDKRNMKGELVCKTCGQYFETRINNLSAAVDVFYDWVDACEEAQAKQPKKQRPVRGPDPLAHGPQGGANMNFTSRRVDDEDAEGEDDVDDVDEPGAPPRDRPGVGDEHDDDDVDDVDEDDVDDVDDREDRDRGEKRRRVAADPDDDEDDED